VKQSERNSDSTWKLLTRHTTPEKWLLLRVIGTVWNFQDPKNGRLYCCQIDSDGNEGWFVQAIRAAEAEWIYQPEAARLLGISRQAIGNAISRKRLATADCNGRAKLYRPDVLALKVRLKLANGEQRGRR
jgi:hypothetical protein